MRTPEQPSSSRPRTPAVGLAPELEAALHHLDLLLEHAVHTAEALSGVRPGSDHFRGLYISGADVQRLLTRAPGGLSFAVPDPAASGLLDYAGLSAHTSQLGWLRQAFRLEPFEIDVLLVALAPEVDLRYERVYAYLHDDVTRRRPTVDLALGLLCRSPAERLVCRSHFAPDAPLLANRLLELTPEGGSDGRGMLSHGLRADEQIVALLLEQDGMDPRLAFCCRWVDGSGHPESLPLDAAAKRTLAAFAARPAPLDRAQRLQLYGPPGAGKRAAAAALAAAAGTAVLELDLRRATESGGGSAVVEAAVARVRIAARQAWFHDAVLYVHPTDLLSGPAPVLPASALTEALAGHPGLVVLGGERPWHPDPGTVPGLLSLGVHAPPPEERLRLWEEYTRGAGLAPGRRALEALTTRFRLTPGQIADVVAAAPRGVNGASDPAGARPSGTLEVGDDGSATALFAAARASSGHELDRLAVRIQPDQRWDDIVLPADALDQLREVCDRIAGRHEVLAGWGFGARLPRGHGVTALFSGPSGTGKTMAAEVVAGELGLDLFRVDLAGVVSKYIGETEKNLDRVFAAAEGANGVLFFDEADALFGKRSEVRDAHDRYANIEISYLLQKMEQHDGIAVLATNLRGNLDDAFVRRLAFSVHFPFPDARSRRQIWERIWPAGAPVDPAVDFDAIAATFELSGGNIRNAALAAAYLAVAAGQPIGGPHLARAIRREYQKLGKSIAEEEILTSIEGAAANGAAARGPGAPGPRP